METNTTDLLAIAGGLLGLTVISIYSFRKINRIKRAQFEQLNKPPISTQALLKRQLSDWQQHLVKLETAPTSTPDQLAYCQRQIARLETELAYQEE